MTKLSSALVLLIAFGSGVTGAQSSPAIIPPVEVVATRIPEAPHDVPASIEVISGYNLRARGVRTLPEALSLAAGVAAAPGGDGGPAASVPEFWGLREFDAFLLVVDGVPWGGALNPALSTLSLRDVERIEILRGPAPVTYGATSFVGVIHVVHSPGAARARYADVYGGTSGTVGGGVDVPFDLGGWNSRLTLDAENRRFADKNTGYRRGHALFRMGRARGDVKSWLSGDLNILKQDPASPHPRKGAALSAAVPLDANHNPAGAFLNENRFALSAGHERPVMDRVTWGSTTSLTLSAQEIFRGFLTDAANIANNASGYRENIDVADFYADTHLIWPEWNKMQFLLGADILTAAGEGRGATFTYTAPLSGETQASVREPATFDRDAEDVRLFAGVYGSTEWHPVPRLNFTAGLRFNSTSEKRGKGDQVTFNKFSGSVGAMAGLWERARDHLRAFANFRSTFKPAAFDFSLAENEGILNPETSRSYEAGLKARLLNGMFDFEASAFHMNFENLVTATVVNGLPALINSGTTRFKGYELASDFRVSDLLSARATYSFHDGRFVDFVQSFDNVPTQLAGKRFEMSARHLASAGLLFAPQNGPTAHVEMNYTGDRYLTKRNTALARPFTTIDAGAGFRAGAIEFRLDGRNLTNRRDAVAESELGDGQYYRMPARTIIAGASHRF